MINNTNKYFKQWNDYFEGGIEMWSYYGYQYHVYLIVKHIISKLDIPKQGKIIQIGTALGTTVELLCFLYGDNRVIGYDLFNPLLHPNIHFLDTDINVPEDKEIAFLDIDVGSMSHARENRKSLLKWACSNMVNNGIILTNKALANELKETGKYDFEIIPLNSFDVPMLWKNVHLTRLNTKVLLKFKK